MSKTDDGMDEAEALCIELATLAVAVTGFLKATETCASGRMTLVEQGPLASLERASLRAYSVVAQCSSGRPLRLGGAGR